MCSSARSRGDSEPLGARVLAMDVDSGDDEPGSAAGSDDDVAMASAGGGGGGGDESDAEPRAASEDDSGVEDSGRRSGAGRLRRAFPAAGQSTKHTHASAARRAAPRAAARAPRLRGRRDPPTGDPRSRSSLSRRALAASSRGDPRRPAADGCPLAATAARDGRCECHVDRPRGGRGGAATAPWIFRGAAAWRERGTPTVFDPGVKNRASLKKNSGDRPQARAPRPTTRTSRRRRTARRSARRSAARRRRRRPRGRRRAAPSPRSRRSRAFRRANIPLMHRGTAAAVGDVDGFRGDESRAYRRRAGTREKPVSDYFRGVALRAPASSSRRRSEDERALAGSASRT